MKNIIVLLVAMLAACGGPIESEPQNVGTLEQPIYMPWNYGIESNQTACSPPWSGGECVVPDRKYMTYEFHHGCTQAERNRMVAGFLFASIEMAEIGWTLDWGDGYGADWTIYCESGFPAGTTREDYNYDCHDTPYGDLCQFQGGAIIIRDGFLDRTDAPEHKKRNAVSNVLKHEIGHTLGFGHQGTADDRLMRSGLAPYNPNGSAPWDRILDFHPDEIFAAECYNPNSTTQPHC